MVLLPLAAVVAESTEDGMSGFWDAVTGPQSVAALKLTVICSLIVVAINGVFGTIIAWILVRDEFRGKGAVNAMIDLPFALPTIVAGLTLLTLYGSESPLGLNVAFTRVAVVFALCFVTLPVRRPRRAAAADRARSRDGGGGDLARGRRIHRLPADHLPEPPARPPRGVTLAFARALGEFGSLVLISGNIPFETEVSSVFIRSQIESGNVPGRGRGLGRAARRLAGPAVRASTAAERWGAPRTGRRMTGQRYPPAAVGPARRSPSATCCAAARPGR